MAKTSAKAQQYLLDNASNRSSASDVSGPESDEELENFINDDSDDEGARGKVEIKANLRKDNFNVESDDDENEDESVYVSESKNSDNKEQYDASKADDDDENEANDDDKSTRDGTTLEAPSLLTKKLKKMSPEQLALEQKKIKKTGVCYLSSIPPYMKPAKVRSILSRFGKVDRLFLKPEDIAIYKKRVKYGGNKKKNFTEGWVEFVNKKDAKLCAATLNGNKLGGKKGSYYYDDVINIKYLKSFKWFDLSQQIAKENEIRESKLSLELSRQQKLNKSFISNVEKSKMINNIKKKRDSKKDDDKDDDNIEVRRTYKQRKVATARAAASEEMKQSSKPDGKLDSVLSKVF